VAVLERPRAVSLGRREVHHDVTPTFLNYRTVGVLFHQTEGRFLGTRIAVRSPGVEGVFLTLTDNLDFEVSIE